MYASWSRELGNAKLAGTLQQIYLYHALLVSVLHQINVYTPNAGDGLKRLDFRYLYVQIYMHTFSVGETHPLSQCILADIVSPGIQGRPWGLG